MPPRSSSLASPFLLVLGGCNLRVLENRAKPGACAVQARPHRAFRRSELVRDLLEALVVVVMSKDDVTIVLGQLGERVAQDGFALAASPRFLRVVGRAAKRRKASEIVEV